MICTSIEQSKHLLELGIDPSTADMSYSEEYFGNDEWCWRLNACKFIDVEGIIPAWSLTALLEVIPKECEPDLQKSPLGGSWYIGSETGKDIYFAHWFADGKPNITDDYENAVDAAYEMVCWLLENGYIKKGD